MKERRELRGLGMRAAWNVLDYLQLREHWEPVLTWFDRDIQVVAVLRDLQTGQLAWTHGIWVRDFKAVATCGLSEERFSDPGEALAVGREALGPAGTVEDGEIELHTEEG